MFSCNSKESNNLNNVEKHEQIYWKKKKRKKEREMMKKKKKKETFNTSPYMHPLIVYGSI